MTDIARGHTDPTTMPPWLYDVAMPHVLGYMATAYLAGVEVGRAAERAAALVADGPHATATPDTPRDEETDRG